MLESLIKEHAPDLAKTLIEKAGFESGQADQLIKDVPGKIGAAVQNLDIGQMLSSGDFKPLLEKLDIVGLAEKVGIDKEKTQAGIESLLPKIQEIVKEKGLSSLLGGDAGGLLDAAKGIAGKLF